MSRLQQHHLLSTGISVQTFHQELTLVEAVLIPLESTLQLLLSRQTDTGSGISQVPVEILLLEGQGQ